jgi:hypothetical protein
MDSVSEVVRGAAIGKKIPKLFVSHASADKDRFVRRFAMRLREQGIDAWVDEWEMNPGDSLLDKIFEEGLKNCEAVIIVLSKHSVSSQWVREELNASFIQRIEKSTKLIPVRIDACEVPECLKSTIWQDIPDLDDCDAQIRRIVNAAFGQYDRPPLGEPPAHIASSSPPLKGLTRIDSSILNTACQIAIEGDSPFVNAELLIERLR